MHLCWNVMKLITILQGGSITEYEINSKAITGDYINWYFTYTVELALRIAFLNQIGCECKDELVESALNNINDWLILECDLSEKCKNPQNQMKQELKKIGISMT